MELIQIDSVKQSFIETRFYQYDQTLRWDDILLLLLDTETGVVYFGNMQPRYDANGQVMVIPRDRLPGVIARARTQASAVEEFRAAKKADEERKRTITQV